MFSFHQYLSTDYETKIWRSNHLKIGTQGNEHLINDCPKMEERLKLLRSRPIFQMSKFWMFQVQLKVVLNNQLMFKIHLTDKLDFMSRYQQTTQSLKRKNYLNLEALFIFHVRSFLQNQTSFDSESWKLVTKTFGLDVSAEIQRKYGSISLNKENWIRSQNKRSLMSIKS